MVAVFVIAIAALVPAAAQSPVDGIQIRLQQAVFDPLLEPAGLAGAARSATADNYYLVQFEGPVQRRWRETLAGRGAEVLDYVPDFAYIVRMDERIAGEIRRLAPVRWVGPFEAGFRLSNELFEVLDAAREEVAVELVVRLFAGEPATVLDETLDRSGAHVVAQYADSGGGAVFRMRVPETAVAELAHLSAVAWIEPWREPAFLNEIARSDIAMGKDGLESVLGLYGQGQAVAVGDSGLSTGDPETVHRDFEGRVIGGNVGAGATCGDSWADHHGHGTHVAGSAVGSGFHSGADIANHDYAGSNAGIAPEALLYVWGFCADFSGTPGAPYADYYGVMRDADPRLRVNTNSWGWPGSAGQYNIFSRETDRFIWDFPDMVVLFAAGNDGSDANADGVVNPGSVSMPSTAKNVITVGASENLRLEGGMNPGSPGVPCTTWGACWPGDFPAAPINDDRVSDHVDGMAGFSSRGPTLSGRLKPDVVAPGTNILSTLNENTPPPSYLSHDEFYRYNLGTSMATPLVAGAGAIVREFYDSVHGIDPGAALVKATLINGAFDMTPGQYGAGATQDVTARPDNGQGWGRVDLPNTLIHEGEREFWFHEHDGLDTGEDYEISFTVVDGGAPFRATLVWADYPGIEATHGALVNDLDLAVEDPGGTVHAGNAVLTGGAPDRVNNVEGVDFNLPEPGVYTITVSGFNIPEGPQHFALAVSGELVEGSGPDFFMNAESEAATICAGETVSYEIGIRGVLGFDEAVTLSVSDGLPAGATADFSVNPVVPADPAAISVLTVGDTDAAAAGAYDLVVDAVADESAKQTGLHLRVFDAVPGSLSANAPADGAFNVPLQPKLAWSASGQAVSYEVEIATDPAFSEIVYHAVTETTEHAVTEELPSNVQLFWRVRAENICGDTVSGTSVFVTVGLAGECSFGTDTMVHFSDDMSSGSSQWTHDGQGDSWRLQSEEIFSGPQAWHAAAPSAVSDQRLAMPAVELPAGQFGYTLQFRNRYATESAASGCFDAGLLEISTDGGESWAQLPDEALLTNARDGSIHDGFGNPAEGLDGWCGNRDEWSNTVVDLDDHAGETVRFRFRLATNKSVGGPGWFVDDVKIQSCRAPEVEEVIYRDRFEQQNDE